MTLCHFVVRGVLCSVRHKPAFESVEQPYAPRLLSSISVGAAGEMREKMGNRIFVGGLPWAVGDNELRTHFESCGDITDAVVVMDRESGRSKGFGFVTFESDDSAQNAIESLDGSEMDGRSVRVSEAKPRPERGAGGPPRRSY